MKTISELNSKWWYRLAKIVFLGFVLLCVVVSIVIISDSYKPIQVNDYKISCVGDDTNHKSFYAQKDLGIYIYMYGDQTAYGSLSDSNKQKLREACDISEKEAGDANFKAMDYIVEQNKLGTSRDVIQKYIDDNMKLYTISEAEITKGSYTDTILYSLLAIIVALVSVEIIRRIFYYILLGSFRPGKVAQTPKQDAGESSRTIENKEVSISGRKKNGWPTGPWIYIFLGIFWYYTRSFVSSTADEFAVIVVGLLGGYAFYYVDNKYNPTKLRTLKRALLLLGGWILLLGVAIFLVKIF